MSGRQAALEALPGAFPAWYPSVPSPLASHTADEPVQPYDQLDESAKGLIEAIQERQAYINAGGRKGGGPRPRWQAEDSATAAGRPPLSHTAVI